MLKFIINIYIKIIILPFKLIFSIFKRPKKYYYEEEYNIWGLSKEDKRIAKEERMSDADYIEAEENDDGNLDYDDYGRCPFPPEDGTIQCSVIFLPLFSRIFIIYNI